jgi:hypothetical protein
MLDCKIVLNDGSAMKKAVRLLLCPALAITYFAMMVQAQAQRSGGGPCRQGALSLIAMLDGGEQSTADYRKTARDVVETCGRPPGRASAPAQIDQAVCGKLALDMLDAIEDGKMNTRTFTQVRDKFAASCAPR